MNGVREVFERDAWRALTAGSGAEVSVLQSWEWGEVQSRWGWRVHRLQLPGGAASVQVRQKLPRLAYVSRGPVSAPLDAGAALAALCDWAREAGAWSLQVDLEHGRARPAGWEPVTPRQPEASLLVTLGQGDLLSGYSPKTRYNVRLAAKRGVIAGPGRDTATLALLAAQTADRQRIALPARAFYDDILDAFGEDATVMLAEHEGEPLAAALIAVHGPTAAYLYGGSSRLRRELMASHLLHHAAMEWSRARGARTYDLWGIPPTDDAAHPWHGLLQFKRGFGGEERHYLAGRVTFKGGRERLFTSVRGAGSRIRRYIIR
ncbi:MAG: lipid II:glycine glycyltransferase FemX [Candidatus Dormibacteria bacterium]